MERLVWETAEELDQKLAQRVRNIRKRRSISRKKLAAMSGVSHGSIKRFETTGQISLISLTKIAMRWILQMNSEVSFHRYLTEILWIS